MSATLKNPEPCSFIVDRRGTILAFDKGMEALTGRSAVHVVGRHKDLRETEAGRPVEGLPLPLYLGEIGAITGSKQLEMTLFSLDGRRLEVEAVAENLDGRDDRLQVSVLSVVGRGARTDLMPEGIEPLPDTDPLTGLRNGSAFRQQFERMMDAARDQAKPLALVLVDIDHLRAVNDRLGRRAGDRALQRLAALLRTRIDDDDKLFRLGDDDFALLLEGSGRGDARQVAAGIRSAARRHRLLPDGGPSPRLTLSIGAASCPADATGARDLLQRATEALLEARRMGRDRVWCYVRRPRVPLEVPVYFDAAEALLVGYTRDLSPSGIFVQTGSPIDMGMRCALTFPLPGQDTKIHVIGRVVRTVRTDQTRPETLPGMGIEFERFGGDDDRRAIDAYLHDNEGQSRRPETGILSI